MYSYFCTARQSDKLADHLICLNVDLESVLKDFQGHYRNLPAPMTAFFEEEKAFLSVKTPPFMRTDFSSDMTRAELSFALRNKVSRWTIKTDSRPGNGYVTQEITFSSPHFKFIRKQQLDKEGNVKESSYRYWDVSMDRATPEKNLIGLYLRGKQNER